MAQKDTLWKDTAANKYKDQEILLIKIKIQQKMITQKSRILY
jgi:hypothetical protein